MHKSYKFIPYSEYVESPYLQSHPQARVSSDNIEVVLSCSNHDETCTCLTHSETLAHIKANWPEEVGL